MADTASPQNETHDWTRDPDIQHLDLIRRAPAVYAPSGALHLVLEVLAYAADEAECSGGKGRSVVAELADRPASLQAFAWGRAWSRAPP